MSANISQPCMSTHLLPHISDDSESLYHLVLTPTISLMCITLDLEGLKLLMMSPDSILSNWPKPRGKLGTSHPHSILSPGESSIPISKLYPCGSYSTRCVLIYETYHPEHPLVEHIQVLCIPLMELSKLYDPSVDLSHGHRSKSGLLSDLILEHIVDNATSCGRHPVDVVKSGEFSGGVMNLARRSLQRWCYEIVGDGDWSSHGQKSLNSASGYRDSRKGYGSLGSDGFSGPSMKSGDGGATGCSGSPSYPSTDKPVEYTPLISPHKRLPRKSAGQVGVVGKCRQAVPTDAARKVNTVKPIMNNTRPKAGFHKSVSPFRKSFNSTTTLRTNFSKQKVNTAGVNSVSVIRQNRETIVKTSAGKEKVLNSPCFMVKSWLVQDQTVLGKDYSNLLIADSLLKTIWFINAPCYGNEALASPKANGVCYKPLPPPKLNMSASQDEIPPTPPPPITPQTALQQAPHTGNGPVSVTIDTNGVIRVLPLRSAEETLARERERKARIILLMALPEDHLAKFHKMTDAKDIWEAIKSRFGGNDKYKKMQEEPKAMVTVDGESVDWTAHAEDKQEDFAFIAYGNSSSDSEVISCSKQCVENYAKLKKLYDEQREKLNEVVIEIQAYSQGLKKVEAQLVTHQNNQLWYEKKIKFMKIDLDDKTDVLAYHKKLLAEALKEKDELKTKVENWHSSSKNLSKLLNTQMSANDKFGLRYGDHRYDGILSYENKVLQSVFMNKESELEKQPLYDMFVTSDGMHDVPPPMTGNYMPSGPDVEIDDSKFTYGPKQPITSESETNTSDFSSCEFESSVESLECLPEQVVKEPKVACEPKGWTDAPIIEEYESDSDDDCVSIPLKEIEQHSFAIDSDNFSHLIRDCNYHEKKMAKQVELNKQKMAKGNGSGESKPKWNNVQRMNHQTQFIPTAVLTRTGRIPVNTARPSSTNKVNTARQNSSQAVLTSAAKKVNTVRPKMNDNKPKTIFHKVHSPFRRPFNRPTTSKANTVKASASWVWKPKHKELNHVIKSNSASKTLTRYDYVDALGSTAGNLVNTASIKRLVLLDIYPASALYVCTAFVVRESFNAPDLWIVVLRIGKLQKIGEFSGVGFNLTQQIVINSPCLTDTKNWLFQCKLHLLASPKQTALGKDFSNPLMADICPKLYGYQFTMFYYEELAIPGQTATGKESSNPFMAGSLPKTIHFCDSLQSDEDSFELIKLMILCTNFLTMVLDLENTKTSQQSEIASLKRSSLGDDASKQGRIDIGDINTDVEITLIDETQGWVNNIIADEDITLIPKLIIKQLKM
ncbi:hypothetical protein Tco_0144884 [Tanacetum coccineum]